jgi:hypothetical protein
VSGLGDDRNQAGDQGEDEAPDQRPEEEHGTTGTGPLGFPRGHGAPVGSGGDPDAAEAGIRPGFRGGPAVEPLRADLLNVAPTGINGDPSTQFTTMLQIASAVLRVFDMKVPHFVDLL